MRTLKAAVACLASILAVVQAAADAAPPQLADKPTGLCPHAQTLAQTLNEESPPAALSREADADTDVTNYFLDIEIIPEYSGETVTAVRVEGVSTIDAAATIDGLTDFTVDLRSNLTVTSVTGNVASWTRAGHTVVITLDHAYDTGQAFQVAIAYQGYPQSAGFGAFGWWERNGNLVVATLSQPYYARYWWPCKDALGDKATMQMHVTVPDPLIAASNGVYEGSEPLSGGRTKYMWHETYPMIPYLASLAITNYERYDIQFDYDEGGGPQTMWVPCYLYPDHWDYGSGQPYSSYKAGCDELPTMLEAFSSAYGLYPFIAEKYGVAETGGSGGLPANMEHQTLTSMYQVNYYSDIMAHELSHQWWGDNVTCATWYDIWLNEGFASFSEALYRELKPGGGVSSYWSRMNDRRPGNPDAQVYRTSIATVNDIFSTNDVYNKGAWVVHMLRHVMGDEAFFAALAAYRATYQGGSVDTAEFAATMSASFGHDLAWFTDEWVMNPGSPDYEWNWATANVGGQDYLKLRIAQQQDLGGYGLCTMPIDIRVTTGAGASVHKIWNDGWTEYYVIPIDGAPLNVEFDEDGGTDDRNWILSSSRAQVATPVEAPPVLLAVDVTTFAPTPTETTIALLFSEDIGTLDVADVTLTGTTSGSHAPASVVYDAGTQSATITYSGLPDDAYTFVVLAADVSANGKLLDGEIDDSAWWDNTLLPSGDGQPGGDAVIPFFKVLGDLDGDGDVDLHDLAQLLGHYGTTSGATYADGDLDFDGDVDLHDLAELLGRYGTAYN